MHHARRSLFVLAAFALVACKTPAPTETSQPPASTATAAQAATQTAATSTAAVAAPAAQIGKPAPDFKLKDLDGKEWQLSALKGKTVVLEWFNTDCPFIKLNHTKGPLQTMAKQQVEKGVVWLSINSSAAGKQGHGAEKNREGQTTYGMTNPILLDEDGATGRAYGAKTTPHMFVIDKQGVLVYRGAIDNAPDGDPRGSDKVINYVESALGELAADKPITLAETEPYGCGVKY